MKHLSWMILFLLASCNGGGSSGQTSPEITDANNTDTEYLGSSYTLPIWINRSDSFGSIIDYSCNDAECVVSGEIFTHNGSHVSQIIYVEFFNETLTKQPSGDYYGQVSYNNPPFVGSYGITLGSDFHVKYIDDGIRCKATTEKKGEYETTSYRIDKINNNLYGFSHLYFGASGPKTICGL